jgi:hypothetical protein
MIIDKIGFERRFTVRKQTTKVLLNAPTPDGSVSGFSPINLREKRLCDDDRKPSAEEWREREQDG